MDVFETVKTVLAVRGYENTPVPAEIVTRIVEAGRLTGSSMNTQPWHFIVVQNRAAVQKLGELARTGPYTAQAPVVIVVAADKTPSAVSDTSRAIQSMVLTAWSDGVGSNWVGVPDPNAVKALLSIPAELDVLAILPFGYPTKEVGKGIKKRKPLSAVASREKFGQAYE
ncbi:MAG TPA: nitroreductase family protein [Anaerolineae bacterium]|jgi:nitroreductase